MLESALQFYIGGRWVEPVELVTRAVVNPATELAVGVVALGGAVDVDRAVDAAQAALADYGQSSPAERIALLERLEAEYQKRERRFGELICHEIGAPIKYSCALQAPLGRLHIRTAIEVLQEFAFETQHGSLLVVREPIGVVGMITPWNFPLNTVVSKVVAALAAGCCVVLKPSEISPFSAVAFAEAIDAAGFPPGVFNLVNGTGPEVGEALAVHPCIAMVSITGSTAAGIRVAKLAADTVKRVHQELGGKSACLLLQDGKFEVFVPLAVAACFRNSGQSCSAPTRLLVPRDQLARVEALASATALTLPVGDPLDENTVLGPVVNAAQFARVQQLIASGIEQGARLVSGGLGKPAGFERGHFVKPTLFSDVRPDMRIAQEEIFGPVLVLIPYDDEEEAIAIANGTPYGLAAYIVSVDLERARRVARRLQAGTVHINFPPYNTHAPFGGYKQSGNGREYGTHGVAEFLEIKSITGYAPNA